MDLICPHKTFLASLLACSVSIDRRLMTNNSEIIYYKHMLLLQVIFSFPITAVCFPPSSVISCHPPFLNLLTHRADYDTDKQRRGSLRWNVRSDYGRCCGWWSGCDIIVIWETDKRGKVLLVCVLRRFLSPTFMFSRCIKLIQVLDYGETKERLTVLFWQISEFWSSCFMCVYFFVHFF